MIDKVNQEKVQTFKYFEQKEQEFSALEKNFKAKIPPMSEISEANCSTMKSDLEEQKLIFSHYEVEITISDTLRKECPLESEAIHGKWD